MCREHENSAIAHIAVKCWDSPLLKDDELVFLHPEESIVPEWVNGEREEGNRRKVEGEEVVRKG